MENIIWQIKAWLVQFGWSIGQAWDSIGGWDGALHWFVAGVIVGCIGWLIYFLIREYRRAPLVEEELVKEPPTQPLPSIVRMQEDLDDWQATLASIAARNPERREARIGAYSLTWAVADAEDALTEAWEEQEERGEL